MERELKQNNLESASFLSITNFSNYQFRKVTIKKGVFNLFN
jgi:hypothetical protein